jgi:pyruvate dehydrogenase E1 component
VIAAAALLESDWGVAGDVWSATSFTQLARDGNDMQRWNLLHASETPRKGYVTQELERTTGPVIASTDYMRMFAEQIRPFIPHGRSYTVLGTDGFGRSDTREKLREHFEVDRHFVVLAALKALADEGRLPLSKVAEAMQKYGIDPAKANPIHA